MPLLPPPTDVVTVYEATTEFEAITIHRVLQDAGVPAMIRSRLLPGYELLIELRSVAGIYADILVRSEQADEARRVIADFLDALAAPPAEEPPPEQPPQ
jgi:hypothetical protein